jgi:hypothetical protein
MESNMVAKAHYLQASEEYVRGDVDAALWAKATASAHGDEKRTQAVFLQLRAEELSEAAAAFRVEPAHGPASRIARDIIQSIEAHPAVVFSVLGCAAIMFATYVLMEELR